VVKIRTIAGELKDASFGQAQIQLESGVILNVPDAIYAPCSHRNLISFRALRENGCHAYTCQSNDGSEVIRIRKRNVVVGEFRNMGNGLYTASIIALKGAVSCNHVEEHAMTLEKMMHARLGHPGQGMTLKLVKATKGGSDKWKGNRPSNMDGPCTSCTLGKFQTKKYEYKISTEIPKFLSQLQVDEHGPITPPSGPFKYFMVIICRSTRRSFIYLLSSKDLVMAQVVKFIIRMKVQYPENSIKSIRFDNAAEFVSATMKTFLAAQGIEHETCVDYAHSQNGSAEAHIKRVQQVARTLLMGCSLPASAWGHAVLHANDLLQYRPPGDMTESPLQLLNGEEPSIAHLRIFGCGVYVPIPPPKRTKLGPQRSLGVYLGVSVP
jgi:hypothetical protein